MEEKSIQPLVSDDQIEAMYKQTVDDHDSPYGAEYMIRNIYEASRAADKKRISELEKVLKELADKSSMLLAFATANLPDDRLESYLMNYACDTEVATARYILTSVTR
jgi:hypothetical protein